MVPPGEGSKGVLLPASWYRAVGDACLGMAKVWALDAVAPMLDEEERHWLEGEPTWLELALTHEAAAGVPEKFDLSKRPSMVMKVDLPWVPCIVSLAEKEVEVVGDALAEEAMVLMEMESEEGGGGTRGRDPSHCQGGGGILVLRCGVETVVASRVWGRVSGGGAGQVAEAVPAQLRGWVAH